MLTKTLALVLRTIKYGDQKLIVDMLTRDNGRASFACRLPKSQRGRIQKQCFQPLNIIEIEFDDHAMTSLFTLHSARIAYPFASIPFLADKLSITLFVAEFLYHATKGEQTDPTLFAYVCDSIRWLDAAKQGYANFHLVFMMRLSRFLGFFPNLDDYENGAYFDLRDGTFTREKPQYDEFIGADDSSKINLLMRINYQSMHLLRMSRIERNRCAELILTYYRLHIPSFPEMKSMDVLRELFA